MTTAGFKNLHLGKSSFTAITQADLLNGYFVKAMSVTAVSGNAAYEDTIEVDKCDAAADAQLVVGINIGSTPSGNKATIYTDGIYMITAGEAVTAGDRVTVDDSDPAAVQPCAFTCAGSEEALIDETPVGVALCPAGSTEQCFVRLGL